MNVSSEADLPPHKITPQVVESPGPVVNNGDSEVVSLDELLDIGSVESGHYSRVHRGGRHRCQPDRSDWRCLVNGWLKVLCASALLTLMIIAWMVVPAFLVGVQSVLTPAPAPLILREQV